MEAGGLIAEVGWTDLDFSLQGEEAEMMAQLLGSLPSHGEGGHQELPWSYQASSAYCDSNGSSIAAPSAYEGYYLNNSNEAMGISSCVASDDQVAADFLNAFPNHSLGVYGNGGLNQVDPEDSGMSVVHSVSADTHERKHLAGELGGQATMQGRKRARKGETKGMKKGRRSGDEDADIPITSASPTSCCTSDSDSQECADADARPKTRTRAARGAATEPQSIYARKRRQRINERLKTLQNLVPNGTKVDISTMLEEAVHYVKFLQLQIKLLSSDDTWMYAPIAYNGINIGIDLNMAG